MDSLISSQPGPNPSNLLRRRIAAGPPAKPTAATLSILPVPTPTLPPTAQSSVVAHGEGVGGKEAEYGTSQFERGAASVNIHPPDRSDDSDEGELPTAAELLSGNWKGKTVRGSASINERAGSRGPTARTSIGSRGAAVFANGKSDEGTRDLPILLSDEEDTDDEPDIQRDATPATAITDDYSDRGLPIPAPQLAVEASHSSLPALPAENGPAGQLLVYAVNAKVSVQGNNNSNDAQAGQNVARNTTSDRNCEQHGLPGTGQADKPSSSHDNSTLTAAPVAEGNIHDVFAEYEGLFGELRGGPDDGGRCTAADPTATTAGLSPCHLSTVHSGGDGLTTQRPPPPPPPPPPPQQQKRTAARAPRLPALPSRKRCGPTAGSEGQPRDDPTAKRLRRSGRVTRVATAVAANSTQPATPDKPDAGHAFPRHYRDKAWKVEDLDDVHLAEDGSLRCVVRWERSVVAAADLVGTALLKRREELFKEKYGTEQWEKWLSDEGLARRGRR